MNKPKERDLAFWRRLYYDLANEVEQTLGKALGYPWYKDDPKELSRCDRSKRGVRRGPRWWHDFKDRARRLVE